jgi:hypothetical protein
MSFQPRPAARAHWTFSPSDFSIAIEDRTTQGLPPWILLPSRWRVKSDSDAAATETRGCSAEHGGSFPDLGRMKSYSAIVQNLVADANALVAYVDAWPCDTCFCFGAVLTAKRAGEIGKSVPLVSWPQSHGCTPPTRARGLMIGDAPRLSESKSRCSPTGTTMSFRNCRPAGPVSLARPKSAEQMRSEAEQP